MREFHRRYLTCRFPADAIAYHHAEAAARVAAHYDSRFLPVFDSKTFYRLRRATRRQHFMPRA